MAVLGIALMVLVVVFRGFVFALGIASVGLNVTLLEFGTALLLVSLARGPRSQSAPRGTGLLRLAGRCSYEIYLTHMFVVLPMAKLFRLEFPDGPPGRWLYPLTYALTMALAIGLGWLVARFFSEPANRWLRGDREISAEAM